MIWSVLCLCLLLSFVLSGLESALLSVSLVRVRHNAAEATAPRGAVWLAGAFSRRERLLSAVLLLNDVVTLLAFAIVTRELVSHCGATGYLLAFAVSLPVYLFVFELVPKSLFARFPYRLLLGFVPFLWLVEHTLARLLGIALLLQGCFRKGNRSAEGDGEEEANGNADDGPPAPSDAPGRLEFRNLTDSIARQGLIGPSETRLIRNILDFPRVEVARIMVPLARVTAVSLDQTARGVLALARAKHLEQLPVLSSDGSIVGLVNVFELLRHPDLQGTVVTFMRRIVRARPGDSARDVLVALRAAGVQLAAISDGDNVPLGIVSAEDLIARMLDGV